MVWWWVGSGENQFNLDLDLEWDLEWDLELDNREWNTKKM